LDEKTILEIKRSSVYGLMAYVLNHCRQPKTVTQILYSNPNRFTHGQLSTLLAKMAKLKLLQKTGKKYETTEKGEQFIKKFEDMLKCLEG